MPREESRARLVAVLGIVIVVAGVILERRGGTNVVLVTQRKKGAHLEGLWELPGGKIDEGEEPRAALVRELREELGIEVTVGAPVEVTSHRYPEKHVLLLFFEATRVPSSPEPTALDVADLRWADAAMLATLQFPAADVAVIAAIKTRLLAASG
jgi:8-oxo-dGTP diphosphatase